MGIEPWRKRLREEIDRTGLPWLEVSKRSSVSQNFVEQFMKEEKRTSVELVLKVCAGINVDPAYIFSDNPSPELRRLLTLAKDFGPDRIRSLLDVLDPQ